MGVRMRCLSQRKDSNSKELRRGAALVETAIVLPIFFLVVLGIIEFGRGFMVMQLVNTAAREGTRSAISDGTNNEEVTAMIRGMVSHTASIPESDVDVDIIVVPYPGNADPDGMIEYAHKRDEIRIDVSVAVADISFVTPRALTASHIRGTSTMRHE